MDVNEVRGGRVFGPTTYVSASSRSSVSLAVHSESRHKLYRIIKRLRDCNHKGDGLKCGSRGQLLKYQLVNNTQSPRDLDRSKVNTECLQW